MHRRQVAERARARQSWRIAFGAMALEPRRYAVVVVSFVAWFGFPIVIGLLLQTAFDRLTGGAGAGWDLVGLLAVLAAVELARLFWLRLLIPWFVDWWIRVSTHLRANLLRAQVASGAGDAGRPAASGGEAVGVFRDDVEDFMEFLDGLVDLAGVGAFALVALAVMVRVDPLVTGVVAGPLVVALVANALLRARIGSNREDDRTAAVAVTGFVGEVFSSVLAVRAAGAERAMVARLQRLNARRARTAVRDRVTTDALAGLDSATVDLALGIVLLTVAGSMRSGDFTVGDLALFTLYLAYLADLPRWAGIAAARRRQLEVAAGRMGALLPGGRPEGVVARRPQVGPGPARLRTADGPAAVALVGVRYRHPGTDRGLTGVDLELPRGTLTVLTGPVGSGKTTLLRVLLGLADPDGLEAGQVRWEGEEVADPAAFMVPPRVAYVAQVPRLFSESLRDNILLGLLAEPGAVPDAVTTVQLDRDLAGMPHGADTLVGARGTRLSGGQAQRVAAARALVRRPALLVLDDLSSALDVTTELALWDRLLGERTATCLAVSHRPAVLARADHVVVLDDGRLRPASASPVRLA